MDVDDAQALIERIRRSDWARSWRDESSYFEIDKKTVRALRVEVAVIVEALGLVPTIDDVVINFEQDFSGADTLVLLHFIQSRTPLATLTLRKLENRPALMASYLGSARSNQSLQTLRLRSCSLSVHQLVHFLRVGCPGRNLELISVNFEKTTEHDLDTPLIGGSNELKKLIVHCCSFGSLESDFQIEADQQSFKIFESCWKDPSIRKPETVEILSISRYSFSIGATIASSVSNLRLGINCDSGYFDTILAAAGKAKFKSLSVEIGTVGFGPGRRETVDEAKCGSLANAIPEMAFGKLTLTLPSHGINARASQQVLHRQMRRLVKAIAKNVTITTIDLKDESNLLTENEKQEFQKIADRNKKYERFLADLDRKLFPDLFGLFGDGGPGALFRTIRARAEAGDTSILPYSNGRRAPPTDGA